MFTILFGKRAIGQTLAQTADDALNTARSIAVSGQPPTIKCEDEAYTLEEFERIVASGFWLNKF